MVPTSLNSNLNFPFFVCLAWYWKKHQCFYIKEFNSAALLKLFFSYAKFICNSFQWFSPRSRTLYHSSSTYQEKTVAEKKTVFCLLSYSVNLLFSSILLTPYLPCNTFYCVCVFLKTTIWNMQCDIYMTENV